MGVVGFRMSLLVCGGLVVIRSLGFYFMFIGVLVMGSGLLFVLI